MRMCAKASEEWTPHTNRRARARAHLEDPVDDVDSDEGGGGGCADDGGRACTKTVHTKQRTGPSEGFTTMT